MSQEKRRQQIMKSWRKWAENNPDKIKEKAITCAQRQKEFRHAEIATRPRCTICGQPFKGRSIASPLTLSLGVHRQCDPARWQAEYRKRNK